MTTDNKSYTVTPATAATPCVVSGGSTTVSHSGTITLTYETNSPYTAVKLTFKASDETTTLNALGSGDRCTLLDGSDAGTEVWAELEIPVSGDSCKFDWQFGSNEPPCTIKIVIKRQ